MQISIKKIPFIPSLLTWPNLIGLDAPIVAVCWQEMFARVLGVKLPWVIHLVLGLSTWCIYLADRILDVIRTKNRMATSRHHFTQRHLSKMIVWLIIISICNLSLIILHVPCKLLFSGFITLGMVAFYYCIRLTRLKHFITLIPREWMCGMLFALGCVIAPQSYASDSWMQNTNLILAVIMFGMICSANCIMISVWEMKSDAFVADISIVKTHRDLLPYMSLVLVGLGTISAIFACYFQWEPFFATGLSAIMLLTTQHYQKRLSSMQLRVLADAALLTPIFPFALQMMRTGA